MEPPLDLQHPVLTDSRPSHRRQVAVSTYVISAISIASILLIAFLGFKYLAPKIVSAPAELPPFAVTMGPIKALPLYMLSEDGESFLPLTEKNTEGTNIPALDRIEHADGSVDYILATDFSSFTTQVFRRNADGTVIQRTDSKTLKYGLTFDPKSGTTIYLSAPITATESLVTKKDWNVTMLKDGTEKVLGKGKSATLLLGGREVVVVSDTSLYIVSVASMGTHELLPLKPYALVTVDRDSSTIAMVNGGTNQIDIFGFAANTPPSYLRSIPLASAKPSALTSRNGEPIIVYSSPAAGASEVHITNIVSRAEHLIRIPQAVFIQPSRISLTHD